MSEETTNPQEGATSEQAAGPRFALQRMYLKDLSFETPKGVEAFKQQWKPQVNQDLNTKSAKIEDGVYEVALRLTITVKHEEETIYLIEVEQAGLFNIQGLEDQQLAQVINTTCPNMLFPYAREVIDSTLVKASFPPLMIPPINFEALFAAAVQQAKAKAEAETAQGEATH